MPTISARFHLLLLVALSLLLVLPCTRAQDVAAPTADEVGEEEEADVPPGLYLTVEIRPNGVAAVTVNSHFTDSEDLSVPARTLAETGCRWDPADSHQEENFRYDRGECSGWFHLRGFLVEGEVPLTRLLQVAGRAGAEWVVVVLRHPEAPDVHLSPAPLEMDLPVDSSSHYYTLSTADPNAPAAIHLAYSYNWQNLRWPALLLGLILLMPVGLTLWMRRAALRLSAADRAAAWYGYTRFLQWTSLGTFLLWWGVGEALHIGRLASFLIVSAGVGAWLAPEMLSWFLAYLLPPMAANAFCSVLSQPVQAQVRGLDWTRREMVALAVWAQVSAFGPLACLLFALSSLTAGAYGAAGLWLVAALVIAGVASQRMKKLLDLRLHALTTGELRDRILALAEKAKVKLQQIFILPAGKQRLANAFARSDQAVMLTDNLLQSLNRREVDAVVAHELSHLKQRHPRALVTIYMIAILGVVFVYPAINSVLLLPNWIPSLTALVVLTVLVQWWFMRRYERAADSGAAELTGDAEALVTALVKVHRLNMMPVEWSRWHEGASTHPSIRRRAEALAQRGLLTPERIPLLLQGAETPGEHYPVPRTVLGEGKVFSTEFKKRVAFRMTWAIFGLITVCPAVVAWVVTQAGWEGVLGWTVYGAGAALTVLLTLVLINYSPLWGMRAAERLLRARLEQEGIRTRDWGGLPVGLSPGDTPRIFENNASWDLGFLFVRGDRLCYVGEEARFTLRRSQVTDLQRMDWPDWTRPRSVLLRWCAEDGGAGAFNLRTMRARSMQELGRESARLLGDLRSWWKSGQPAEALPERLAALGPPQIGEVSSASPHATIQPKPLITTLIFVALVAWGVAAVFGLPLNLVGTLSEGVGALMGVELPQLPPAGPGWYVVAVALAMSLFLNLPRFLYREAKSPAAVDTPGDAS